MTYLDAALQILQQAGQPLHYREITERALAATLITPTGLTPDATMGSRLYSETKEESSAFLRSSQGRGYFGLAAWQPTGIDRQVQQINNETRTDLRHLLNTMPPERFEVLISELLIQMGFDESTVQTTRYNNDKGIDVRGVLRAAGLTDVHTAVQAKRWKGNVGSKIVQELRGSLVVHQQGVIITTSDFTASAIAEASAPGKTRISLINGDQLLDLLIRHRVGVQEKQLTVLTLDEEWWTETLGVTPQSEEQPVTAPIARNATTPPSTASQPIVPKPVRPTKEIHITLFNQNYVVTHWRDILIKLCESLIQRHPDTFAATAAQLRGRKRQYIAPTPEGMYSPTPIPGTDLYIETNLSSSNIVTVAQKLLTTFGYIAAQELNIVQVPIDSP